MKMKKTAMLVTALVFALGVSVCSAHCTGRGGYGHGDTHGHDYEYAGYCRHGNAYGNGCGQNYAYAANCKDGVCEFTPASSGERAALAVINPCNNAVADIEGQWESDVKQLGPHDTFVTAQGEAHTGVVFSVNNPIKNFKVLSLHFKDFDNNGKPVFLVKELYAKPVFSPDRQLLVKFAFFGSIPNNGISYTDPAGKTRYYSVSQSGKDGSLLFTEF